jgi:hypothetical protein
MQTLRNFGTALFIFTAAIVVYEIMTTIMYFAWIMGFALSAITIAALLYAFFKLSK